MSGKDYGIESMADAFLALKDMDEDIKIPNNAKRKGLKEAASVDVRNPDDVELAQNFRKTDKKEEDSELEVIDVDADSVENLQDGKSYIGKMLLQCNSCKATRFIDVDKLVADENDKELYNVEDECPHCHNKGTGYALIGQVGKADEENPEDEASLDNDTKSDEEAMFDNTDEVEPESEETPTEENTESNEESASDEETSYDDTNAEDDTNDMELPELGDEFDVDDVLEDDTEEESDDEDKKKVKKESLTEDADEEPDGEFDADHAAEWMERHPYGYYNSENDYGEYADEDDEIAPEAYGDELINDFETRHPWNDDLDEKLDMATFEGSIANLIDTFTIEDNPVNIKLLNKNGSELGMYGSDDLPFNVKSQMMDTFNTDDNYLEINVTEEGSDESTTVNDLFNYYRPDEENQTTFVVTNVDTDEEEDFEDLTEFLEKYGDYYIDGALGLRTLNIYIADGDLETEVEPLDDEEIEELGKENAEKEEAEVTEESLIEEIIKSYPGLKLNRINNSLAEEYFIAESIKLNEDIDLVYKNFVKPTNNEKLIEHFKSYTGYEDEVDKFLKEHNISKEKYNKIINEDVDKKNYIIKATFNHSDYYVADKNEWEVARSTDENINIFVRLPELDKYFTFHPYGFRAYVFTKEQALKLMDIIKNNPKCQNNGLVKVIIEKFKNDVEEEVEPETTTFNEKLLTSVKTRSELGEAINKLVEAKQKYHIKKSVNEGYRYDIFVNEDCKLNEEDTQDNLPNHLRDADYEEDHDYELDDLRARDEQGLNNDGPDETEMVPEGMSPEEVEIVQKIDRIANDIAEAISDTYNVDAQKNLIVADIVQDLQLIGGAKVVDELKNTPIDELTKLMYQEFNGLFDKGEDSANKLALALAMLDSDQFSTETIRSQIASPRFLQAAKAGYIPFIDAAQLNAPVDESLNEESEMNDDNSSIEDCKTRYEELKYLATQRELTVEEQEDLEYCEKRLVNCCDDLNDIDNRLSNEEFDNCINEYLNSSDLENSVAYRSLTIEKLQEGIKINGIIESSEKDKSITFTLKPILNESNNSTDRYIVTNNLNGKKFNLDL